MQCNILVRGEIRAILLKQSSHEACSCACVCEIEVNNLLSL